MELCSANEMMAIDRRTIEERGLPGVILMENAGRGCCDQLADHFVELFPGPVLVVAGVGNNGGDGYVMARVLSDRGWRVETIVLGPESKVSGDARVMLNCLQRLALPITFIRDESHFASLLEACRPALIVDAIFGTGLNSKVRDFQAAVIELLNEAPAPIFAVDIPSGVDASNGRICGTAIRAALTVTFDRAKIGHASQPGAACVGRLVVVDIGIPRADHQSLKATCHLLDSAEAAELLPERSSWGHKGSFGHLLVVAGSRGKTGAAVLAGEAGARSGCGLVTVAVPDSLHDIIEGKLTEAMSVPLPSRDGQLNSAAEEQIVALQAERQALVIGPGLGTGEDLAVLLGRLLPRLEQPLLIDADGLNLLVGQLETCRACGVTPILTPHPGEMARLTGLKVSDIEADRFEVARDFAARYQVVLLLKGARTLVAAPDGRVTVNGTGNDGLASGGSGDVLSGLIGGLLAQGLDPFTAASLGAWLHGRSAELVAVERGTAGLIASDLVTRLSLARNELQKGRVR